MAETAKKDSFQITGAAKRWYFQCSSNLNAPPMAVDSIWEAKDMRTHPDYFEVDEDGLPVADPDAGNTETQIYFSSPRAPGKKK